MKCNGSYAMGGKCWEEVGCGEEGCPVNTGGFSIYRAEGLEGAIQDVTDFHNAMGQPVHRELYTPSDERLQLRADLIMEECMEFMESVFPNVEVQCFAGKNTIIWGDKIKLDHEGAADALADLIYVCIGAANEFGIPLDKVWDEVHRSNMAKIGPNGEVKRRADGKVSKPDGWTPPDIKGVLGIK